jgi:UDP-N-acetylmuramoyl-L-alanyl-D-glutamate--2,6-diaminopimelate ligase
LPADLSLRSIEPGRGGNRYEVYDAAANETLHIEDRLPGAFNAGNVLAALLTVGGALDVPVSAVASKVPELKPVRGRMTRIERGQPFEVLVDYAHTPSSFQTIFPPLRTMLDKTGGRIIALFGSAGERDTAKRSEQGKIAADYSDIVILTDEDPRGENPMGILEEIAQGCYALPGRMAGKRPAFTRNETIFLIPDRRAAIRKALALVQPGDLVLLLGKGHENSIIYANGPMPFDEIGEAEKALAEIGY